MTHVPTGWVSGPLQGFITPRGEKVSPAEFPHLPFLGMDHVEAHTAKIIGSVPSGEMKSNASRFCKDDVLYGRLRPYLNKVAQPSFDGLASAEFIVFQGNELILSSFLKYRLHAQDFVAFASHLNEGDRPRVSFDQIGGFEILVPPPTEQRRIVERIEALFDEIDRGVESLRTAQRMIGLYRQSLLKSAFEGRLTAQWRAENTDKLETAEAILARIHEERVSHHKDAVQAWNRAVDQWRTRGAVGRKPAKPKAPMVDCIPDTGGLRLALPELPEGWAWARLGCSSIGPEYGTAAKSSTEGEVPVVRMGNIQNGRINWADLVYTSDEAEVARYALQPGDVLFNRTNSPDLVGKTAIYEGERPAVFAGYLIRVNQIDEIASGPYITHFLNSPRAREHGKSVKTDGVNQSNINGSKLQDYPLPLCSSSEQAEVVRILDARLEAANVLGTEIDTSLARAEALRQSVLTRAFSGELVRQDPTDEPASVLLARLRAECDGATESQSAPRRPAATASA